jgi:hypothetical protein
MTQTKKGKIAVPTRKASAVEATTPSNPAGECKANTVPPDWILLGMRMGMDPKLAEKLRLFVVGPMNEGKTTFISSIPDNIILDFDDGAFAIPKGRAKRIHIKDYDHLKTVVEKLCEDAKNNRRMGTRVTFDTVDEFVALIKRQLEHEKKTEDITEFGQKGHGYNLILNRMWRFVVDLGQAGYAWTFLGHLTSKIEYNPITKKDEAKVREAIYPGIARRIRGQADFKITIYCIPKIVKKEKERMLPDGRLVPVPAGSKTVKTYYANVLTNESAKDSYPGDNKARGVVGMAEKFELPLVGGWDKFKSLYAEAVEETRKLDQS